MTLWHAADDIMTHCWWYYDTLLMTLWHSVTWVWLCFCQF